VTESALPVPAIETETPDVFDGIPDLVNIFNGIADYLSLWCSMYGLREDRIRYRDLQWSTAEILTFRISHQDGSPISPIRYDPRLPEIPGVFVARALRMRRFIAGQERFRRLLYECEWAVRSFLAIRGMTRADIELTSRWTSSGRVVLKMIPKSREPNSRRYETHRKYES